MCTVCFLKLHSMIALITLNSTIGTCDNILQKYVKHIRKYALYSDGISQVSRLDHWLLIRGTPLEAERRLKTLETQRVTCQELTCRRDDKQQLVRRLPRFSVHT